MNELGTRCARARPCATPPVRAHPPRLALLFHPSPRPKVRPGTTQDRWPYRRWLRRFERAKALTNPQSLAMEFFFFLISQGIQATSEARRLRLCRMVRVGESRHSFPLPDEPSEGLCLSFAGRSRAEPRRTHKRAAMRLQVQVWTYPHPRPAFALGSRFRGFSFYRLTHRTPNRA